MTKQTCRMTRWLNNTPINKPYFTLLSIYNLLFHYDVLHDTIKTYITMKTQLWVAVSMKPKAHVNGELIQTFSALKTYFNPFSQILPTLTRKIVVRWPGENNKSDRRDWRGYDNKIFNKILCCGSVAIRHKKFNAWTLQLLRAPFPP